MEYKGTVTGSKKKTRINVLLPKPPNIFWHPPSHPTIHSP